MSIRSLYGVPGVTRTPDRRYTNYMIFSQMSSLILGGLVRNSVAGELRQARIRKARNDAFLARRRHHERIVRRKT